MQDCESKTVTKYFSKNDAKALFNIFEWNLDYLAANISIKKVPTHYSQEEGYTDTIFIHEPVMKSKIKRINDLSIGVDRSIQESSASLTFLDSSI